MLIQRVKYPEDGQFEGSKSKQWDGSPYGYRTGYYTYDKTEKRIVWGQYTPFLTEKEYKSLLEKAKEEGWPIF